jgi:hypothetical protein
LSDWTVTAVQLNPMLPGRFFSLSAETVFALK